MLIPSGVAVLLRRGYVRDIKCPDAFHGWDLSGERGDDADMRLALGSRMHSTIVDMQETAASEKCEKLLKGMWS